MKKTVKKKRYNFLSRVIQKNNYNIGAEIGCEKGTTAACLLGRFPRLQLYAVDLWEWQPDVFTDGSRDVYKNWDFKSIKQTFDQQIALYKDRVTILRGISWEMAELVSDESLDFIFIDADHGYESVKKDIIAWTPKLKSTGMMSGHDNDAPGVIQATLEMVQKGRLAYAVDKCWYCKKEDIKI